MTTGKRPPHRRGCAQRPLLARKAAQVHECGAATITCHRRREAPVKASERAAWSRRLGPARRGPAGQAAAAWLPTAATASPAGSHGNRAAAITRGPAADAPRRGVPPRAPNSAASRSPAGCRAQPGGAAAARARRSLRRSPPPPMRPARAPAGLAGAPAGCLQRVAVLAV